MKKTILYLFISISFTFCKSKVSDSELEFRDQYVHYKGKLYTGKVFHSYSNGKIQFEGEYRNGLKIGDWVSYFPDGSIESEEHYFIKDYNIQKTFDSKPLPKGVWKRFYSNGKLSSIDSWDNNGIRNGISEYFDENGFKLYTVNYIDDEKSGNEISYYHQPYYINGKVKYQIEFKATWPTGVKTEYYKNGKIKSTTTYVDGFKHGIQMGYNLQGVLMYKYLFTTKIPDIFEEQKILYENKILINNHKWFDVDDFPQQYPIDNATK